MCDVIKSPKLRDVLSPAATHDLQPLRSFGVGPEGMPETVAVVARSLADTKLCLGPDLQAPEGSKVNEAPTKSPLSEES